MNAAARIFLLLCLAYLPLLSRCFAADGPANSKTAASEEKQTDRFVRVTRDADDNPLAMQTAIKRYVPADETKEGPVVDLIAAVHIADGAYYRQLNEEFKQYDALLFELVAPTGAVPKRGETRSTGIVSGLQNMMKDILDLEFQLTEIDYEQKNFVHADMSPQQFSQTMRDRGESPFTMFMSLMKASAAAQQSQREREPASPALVLKALFDREEGPGILKRIFADELSEVDVMLEALNGESGSTIITERNKVALKVLREQIDDGKTKLGIFYGSGHMPDIEERLISDFDLKLKETRWLTAWDLKEKPKTKTAAPKSRSAKGTESKSERPARDQSEKKREKEDNAKELSR